LFLTFFQRLVGHGLSNASKPCSLVGSSPNHFVGDFHFAHKPAITICASSAIAIAYGCFSFPFASSFFHS
jgi:hypothetical protein